jgi:DNA ligase-1
METKQFKPMLAAKLTKPEALQYPMYISPKLDGVRAMVVDGKLVSRNLKLIPNRYTQVLFGQPKWEGLDGELIVGDPCDKNVFQATSSGVMSRDGLPTVKFHVFDKYDHPGDWDSRNTKAYDMVKNDKNFVAVPHYRVIQFSDVEFHEGNFLQQGYEGAMLRGIHSPYKHGRSTEREGYLIKVKRFEDSEAVVFEVIELEHNDNEKITDELGRSKRSSHKANKRKGGTMGALRVRDIKTGVEFEIGTGFSQEQRDKIWRVRAKVPATIVKYKYFAGGVKDKPRFPVFLGFRSTIDL